MPRTTICVVAVSSTIYFSKFVQHIIERDIEHGAYSLCELSLLCHEVNGVCHARNVIIVESIHMYIHV